MRVFTVFLTVAMLAFGFGCRKKEAEQKAARPAEIEVLARCHFVGTTSLASNTNAAKLKELWNLPETQHLVEQTLQKLAHSPRTFYGARVTPDQDQRGAMLLRPMLDDLFQRESFLQLRGPSDKATEWTLLVQLPANRLKLWQTNLTELVQLWKLGAPATNTVQGFPAWEVKGTNAPAFLRCVEAGQWLVFGAGQNDLAAIDEAVRRIKMAGRPINTASNYWLETELNLPRLANALDLSPTIKWPRATLTVMGQGEYLRSNMRMVFREPATGPLDPWQVPTNIINEPLVSFTAARGVSPWLTNCALFQKLELTSAPNELFFWAQSHVAFQTFVAFPIKDAASKLEHFGDRASSLFGTNWQSRGLAQISWQTNTHQVFWKSLPYITPYLKPAEFEGTDYVVGGLFPSAPLSNPPPAELLSQLTTQPKLVYYDWEITQARLSNWRIMAQLFAVIADKPQFTTNTAGLPWLMAVEPKLGNTVTEITADSPTELSLVRKSHIGFTGVELVALTRWLESTNFPRLSFDLPMERPMKPGPKTPPPAVAAPKAPAQKPPGR